jgi:hypothetical protein
MQPNQTDRKMSQWDYQNFPKSNDFFFKKSGVCDQISLSIFVFHISANFHTKKEKNLS